MKMPLPGSRLVLLESTVSLHPALPQTSYFQCYRRGSLRKSLWKKSPGSGMKLHPQSKPPILNARPNSVQVLFFQHDTDLETIHQAFTGSKLPSISLSHLLHSSRAISRLRVTRDGICPIAADHHFVPGSPHSGARIVPLTRLKLRTILTEVIGRIVGARPRKFFRE